MTTFIKSPYKIVLPRRVKLKLEKFGTFAIIPMNGVSKSFTIAVIKPLKEAPMTTPTARSTALPLKINSLKPSNTFGTAL